MHKLWSLLFLLSITAVSSYAQGSEKKVRLVSLKASGSERYSEAEIVRATGLEVNDDVTQHDLEEAANRLGATGVFVGVHFQFLPVSTGISATYQVTDNAGTAPVIFENFVWFAPDQLEKELHERVPLFQGRLPNAGTLLEDTRLALQALVNSKNIRGTVKTAVNGQLGQFTSVSFSVEDTENRIAAIKFQGAKQLDSSLLEDASHALLHTGYSQSAVRTACNTDVKNLYLARGFLKAHFGDPVYRLTKEADADSPVEVTVAVEEGPQYHLAAVTWSGNTVYSSQQLQRLISLQTGELANAIRLEKDLAPLRKLYGPHGYLGVTHKLQAHPLDNGTANFEVELHEGVAYQMGKLTIRGGDPDSRTKIQELWKLAPGATYDADYPIKFIVQMQSLRVAPNLVSKEDIDDQSKIVDVTLDIRP
jgi:outer membrane protein insertion porin family